MPTKDSKGLKPYYEMENDKKLHPRHRCTIKIFNRIQNGDPPKPGIRDLIYGKELQGAGTSIAIGLFSVSDINSGYVIKKSRHINGKSDIEELRIPGIPVAGNTILIGPPGGAKTRLAQTLASLTGLTFEKVSMTADLTPHDITVKIMYTGLKNVLVFGPAFAHILFVDEINRGAPKTQGALLERMTSGTITYEDEEGKGIFKILPQPCFTIAAENSAELGGEGTYSLPEAQLDRFMLGVKVPLPSEETMKDVLDLVPGSIDLNAEPLTSEDELLDCRDFIMREIYAPKNIKKYITRLMMACRNPSEYNLFPDIVSELDGEDFIMLPPNTRAAIHTMHAAKTLACISGNREVTHDNVKKRFYELVNHRFKLGNRAVALSRKYGNVRQFIELLIKGDARHGIKGILDVVPVDSDE